MKLKIFKGAASILFRGAEWLFRPVTATVSKTAKNRLTKEFSKDDSEDSFSWDISSSFRKGPLTKKQTLGLVPSLLQRLVVVFGLMLVLSFAGVTPSADLCAMVTGDITSCNFVLESMTEAVDEHRDSGS